MSYPEIHLTHFNWRRDVHDVVKWVQHKHPWQTYINTYLWHPLYDPPDITKQYDSVSFDVWGGGVVNGIYRGYRGKPLPMMFGKQIKNELMNKPGPEKISWLIHGGKMWVRGEGWQPAPPGPPDSDPGHYNHLHVTYE